MTCKIEKKEYNGFVYYQAISLTELINTSKDDDYIDYDVFYYIFNDDKSIVLGDETYNNYQLFERVFDLINTITKNKIKKKR